MIYCLYNTQYISTNVSNIAHIAQPSASQDGAGITSMCWWTHGTIPPDTVSSRSPRWQRHCLIFGCRAASVASVAKQGFDVAHGVIMAWQRIAAGMVKHCHHRAPFFLLRVVVKGLSMKERTGRTFLGFCSPCSMLNEGLMLMLAPNWMWYGAKETSLSDSFFG